MKHVIQPLAWGLAIASILATASSFALGFVAGTVQAATPHHEHGHAQPLLRPANGQQWATDAALREGMTRIHEAVDAALAQAPDEGLNDAQARDLQQAIDAAAAYLTGNCRLAPEPDAALHALLGQLLQGAEALGDRHAREAALGQVIASLQQYSELFSEPRWREAAVAAHH
ncbi:DnrO protein [Stutzerimonas stutzeri]|uniref:DnrO protein n=1 Tax=Stutzerimonas sp. S1 TaxID=3030652 RepID=UPI00222479A3|nr:DnrO protein [Stutzerimonas sp. S1]MCW3147064.1 DnrO protein [Stutzerimonas sp. S1]